MQSYNELVEALRYCKVDSRSSCVGCQMYADCEGSGCINKMHDDAADAIEALIDERDELAADIAAVGRALTSELEQQIPKQGEWELIDGVEPMRWGCSRCKYLSWETSNYCPRCGAKMTEVQDGQ